MQHNYSPYQIRLITLCVLSSLNNYGPKKNLMSNCNVMAADDNLLNTELH